MQRTIDAANLVVAQITGRGKKQQVQFTGHTKGFNFIWLPRKLAAMLRVGHSVRVIVEEEQMSPVYVYNYTTGKIILDQRQPRSNDSAPVITIRIT